MTEMIAAVMVGLGLGGGIAILLARYFLVVEKRRAQSEAIEILEKAQDQAELLDIDQKDRIIELEEELWGKVEAEIVNTEEKLEDLESLVGERKEKVEQNVQVLQKSLEPKQTELQRREQSTVDRANNQKEIREKQNELKKNFAQNLAKQLGQPVDEFKNQLMEDVLNDAKIQVQKDRIQFIEEVTSTLEMKAKRLLGICIDRFARPFCPERGLGFVELTPDRKHLLEKDGVHLRTIQEICGCDLVIDEEQTHITVAGFDPVRRELTRRLLEKLAKDRKGLNPDHIKRRHADVKRELFRQIKQDGDQLAKELRLDNLHPEIRQMMGSLRYRYSFTQNQYFHCAEVGWLCGLLASELDHEVRKARRTGMLHDIGKSMDHAMEGGHAVIGADFIQKRGEGPEVVHAVRAHHFDEQPSTDLAFLVIAADAISGARPGARRSTIESYNQKVTELEAIGKSFPGVDDCFVLSGGRELRVLTNGRQVDDARAIELAKLIATRIENEMNYPGQIKVVVVRATLVQESTTRAG